jgi:hypothetical protein
MAGVFMKKFFVSLLILCVLGGAAFFIGWIQFAIPAGMYGVLVSKTGGVNMKPIEPGTFRWQWERLLPTNTIIHRFSLTPQSVSLPVTGKLPSADIYSSLMDGSPDFSYNISVAVSLSLKAQYLPDLVRNRNITEQYQLDDFLKVEAKRAGAAAVQYLVSSAGEQQDISGNSVSRDNVIHAISAETEFPEIEITEISFNAVKMPDMALYRDAQRFYLSYYEQVRTGMLRSADAQAAVSSGDYLQIERFARWGKILTEYPILIDFIAVSRDDAAAALGALESMRAGNGEKVEGRR